MLLISAWFDFWSILFIYLFKLFKSINFVTREKIYLLFLLCFMYSVLYLKNPLTIRKE